MCFNRIPFLVTHCLTCVARRVGGRTEVITVGDNLHIPSLKLCYIANVQVSGGVKRYVQCDSIQKDCSVVMP